jgi:three-Cys-motif partner protein
LTEHRFGGSWTDIKLTCLRKYLEAYRHVFVQNEKARFFTTWFVDAFAGTGSRIDSSTTSELSLFDDVYQDVDTARYRDGSATIASGLAEPFDQYLFIEKSNTRLSELSERLKEEHPQLVPRCSFEHGDANNVLKRWCRERNWSKDRAVVFLDPYGMQVEWSTIEVLAGTKAVDLWYLFPLGVGVSRLLKSSGDIEESWKARLDSVLGTREWRERFYQIDDRQPDLFGGTHETIHRTATPSSIEEFIRERLVSCFEGVAKGLMLYNSKSSPMYLLCFAAANKRGAPTAIKIAQSILGE